MNFYRLLTSKSRLTSAAVIFVLACGSSFAQTPNLLNYQGRLTSGGTPVDTTVSVEFTLYGDSLGDLPVWSETQPGVIVDDGLFAVLLGSVTPLPSGVFGDSSRYLGVRVGDDPEGRPLTRIVSTAYALKAARSDTAAYAEASGGESGWVDDGSVVRLTTGSDKIGIGTSTPTNMVHIVGTDSQPLLNIEKTGSGRGLRISTTSACALWVASSGNHGLRVSSANGDGVHVTTAGGYAGYFGGKGYFSSNLGVGTLSPVRKLDVVGGSIGTDSQLVSTIVTGTSPLDVRSETMVTNLNADMLDGQHGSAFAEAGHSHAGSYSQAEVEALLEAQPRYYSDLVTESTNGSAEVTVTFPGSLFKQVPSLAATAQFNHSGFGQLGRVTVVSITATEATLYVEDGSGSPLVSSSVQISYTATE